MQSLSMRARSRSRSAGMFRSLGLANYKTNAPQAGRRATPRGEWRRGALESASMAEIIFVVEDAPDGGLTARAVGESIFTQAATMSELHDKGRDAVRCHFDDGTQPRLTML